MDVPAFAELTHDEQVQRLEILARAALRDFGIVAETIEPLDHAENTTFRVRAAEGEFCLRVCRPGYQSDAQVASEIAFVGAMRRAGFDVPRPYGDRVVKVAVEGVPEARNCVLLGWQTGKFAEERLQPAQAEALGRAIGGMHTFAASWTPPMGFDRQTPSDELVGTLAVEAAPEEHRSLLREVAAEAWALLPSLPRDVAHFGLIHGDLHRGNLLFEDGRVRIIDFDDLGWGFWIGDIAAALFAESRHPTYPEVSAALLAGYEAVRPLPPRTRELLPAFLRFRALSVANWVLRRTDNPRLREEAPEWVAYLCERIRATREA